MDTPPYARGDEKMEEEAAEQGVNNEMCIGL